MRGKVLFVATVYSHLAAFHAPFMSLLQEEGYEVHAAAAPDHRKCDVQALGVRCWDICFARSPFDLQNLRAYKELKVVMQSHHYSLVHVHTPVAAFLARYLARVTSQGPVLYTAHGFHFYEGAPLWNWLVYYTAERIAAGWTDGLIVINTEDLETAQRMGFTYNKDLFYVPGVGVDLTLFSREPPRRSIRSELGLGLQDIVVTCVAEMNPNKNHRFLLQAWKHVSSECPICHLVLVGTGSLMPVLRSMVERENISRVHFLGYRSDVPNILFDTDVVVLTSRREGLPRCIMEAMGAGKPVVATDVRGSRDLVEHGRTGFLVKLGDLSGLVAALGGLVNDVQLRTAMGTAAREKVRHYSLDTVLSHMRSIYERYLS